MNYKKLIGKTVYSLDITDEFVVYVVPAKITDINVFYKDQYIEVHLDNNIGHCCDLKDGFPSDCLRFNKKDFKKSDIKAFIKAHHRSIKAFDKTETKRLSKEIDIAKKQVKVLKAELKAI